MKRRRKGLLLLGAALLLLAIAQRHALLVLTRAHHTFPVDRQTTVTLIAHPTTTADLIVNGAKTQVLRGVRYDASYVALPYPGGDVPSDRGACTEVIVRALRAAGLDLQRLIHEDMTKDFSAYPDLWGLDHPDPNIDHRRVPNHIAFLSRHGEALPLSTAGADAASWQAGDLIYWKLPLGSTHCGVISNDRGRRGLPLVIHNMGPAASQEDCLDRWEIIGHFRYPGNRKQEDSRLASRMRKQATAAAA